MNNHMGSMIGEKLSTAWVDYIPGRFFIFKEGFKYV
ncbi:hypothetical protein CLHUN_27520 [Ruminiclostridium hungatei]|uniref:Uncharacterized protein n=1 Tax=Ruminiclostridium hungatei TaxID=48256 RepID=A0A1V4SJH8_RUMHU|nr:hypothetical protein CLHUN_27520 [Ruminiclostridium hungatei]